MEYFLARQAIFNANLKVYCYELSFRSHLDEKRNFRIEDDQTVSRVLNEVFFLIGLKSLTGGESAFIRFSKNLLLDSTPELFAANQLIVGQTKDIKPDEELMRTCAKLKNSGYTVLFEYTSTHLNFKGMSEYCNIVRLDLEQTGAIDKAVFVAAAHDAGLKCLVSNVNSMLDFHQAVEMGFDYFQGSFFSKPFVVAGREIPGFKLNYLQLINEFYQPEIDFTTLENIIKRDVSLTYKLLKMINSSAIGLRNEIKSIKQALVLLGLKEVKRWISLVILGNMANDRPDELVKSSLFRAKFCEFLGPKIGLHSDSEDLFLMGMFSMIDAFIPQSMPEILESIPLSQKIKDALLKREGKFGDIISLAIEYEKGNWVEMSRLSEKLGVENSVLPAIFMEAIEHTNKVFN